MSGVYSNTDNTFNNSLLNAIHLYAKMGPRLDAHNFSLVKTKEEKEAMRSGGVTTVERNTSVIMVRCASGVKLLFNEFLR